MAGLTRDPRYEETFLKEVSAEASRRAGINATAYVSSVQSRLALGAERYGDSAFLQPERDNLREVTEETPDCAAYALLELQRLNQADSEMPDGVHHHLFEASVYAAIADWHARQAKRARAHV